MVRQVADRLQASPQDQTTYVEEFIREHPAQDLGSVSSGSGHFQEYGAPGFIVRTLTEYVHTVLIDTLQIIMAGQHYCLRWNNYQSNMTSVFHQLLRNEAFVDVTLACNDSSLKAHKVVLSACSSYFQKLLLENPCKHPTIIMPQDVCFSDLKFIIEFVYRGEIDVSQAELQSLLKTADQLKIKGLCEVPEGKEGANYSSAEN
uniref:BTB domain-containing protein n=1 Tax=Timema cristinae TaxID=61476 RepID=A0A7R9GNZ1_TIMCR|nr:unnamed protein product [Timema cristinae]